MKTRHAVSLLLLIALLSACNLSTGSATGTIPPATTASTNTIAQPTDTQAVPPTDTPLPLPTDTHTLAPTDTLSVALVTPKTDAANCRFGPSTAYVSVGGLKVGATVPVLGQNGDGTWWQIQNPNNVTTNCWVAGTVTNISGNLASVPVVPSPVTSVTKVSVTNPDAISVPGCIGPIQPLQLIGTIDVNGPTSVTWHFETQQGGALPSHTLVFSKYGPLSVMESSYTPPLVAGTYWIKLFITAPNSVTAEGQYTISCP